MLRRGEARIGWRSIAARHVPFFGLLAVYLGARRLVLGHSVGGDLREWPARIDLDWTRFLYPAYEFEIPSTVRWGVGALIAVVTLGCLFRVVRGPGAESGRRLGGARLWTVGILWIVLGQLPFGVANVGPTTGRFWYFSSAGIGLLVAAAVGSLAPTRWRRPATITFALILGLAYVPRLLGRVEAHIEASRWTREVATQIRAFARASSPERRYFLMGHPEFVEARRGELEAQVFQWGLSDALAPPFSEPELRIYPLPSLSRERLVPLFERPDVGEVLRLLGHWIGHQAPFEAPDRPRIHILRPPDGVYPGDSRTLFEAPDAHRYGIVVLSRGNAVVRPISAPDSPDGIVEGHLPFRFIESMRRLYDDEVFWWIEALDRKDRPVASSELRTIPRI